MGTTFQKQGYREKGVLLNLGDVPVDMLITIIEKKKKDRKESISWRGGRRFLYESESPKVLTSPAMEENRGKKGEHLHTLGEKTLAEMQYR